MRTLLVFPLFVVTLTGCRDSTRPAASAVPVTAAATQRVDSIREQPPRPQPATNGHWTIAGSECILTFANDGTAQVSARGKTITGRYRWADPAGVVLTFPGAFSGSVTDAYFTVFHDQRSLQALGSIRFDLDRISR
jgi:hypothetical protein